VILVALTERGVSAMQQHTFKLGADASVALGPVGIGAAAATALASVDIVSFARAKGLYAGLSLEGSVVAVREDWNTSYYGRPVSPADILINRVVRNPHAAALIGDVTKVAVAR